MEKNSPTSHEDPAALLVGTRLKNLRTRQGYSLRALAEQSGLNANTLSLIENGKSSPSVSTLQQLSTALEVPIVAFFESEPVNKKVVFTRAAERPIQAFGSTEIQNLARDYHSKFVQPFIIRLLPGSGSGDRPMVHTGFEFVFCLSGIVQYQVNDEKYDLHAGDSLIFEAHLPHTWENCEEQPAQLLLVFLVSDEHEKPGGVHFSKELLKKEINMKIAIVSDDGTTISQHFGRATYYLVVTIEQGQISHKELRQKVGHNQFHSQEHDHTHEAQQQGHGEGHGMDTGSHHKHASMAETIADCESVICGGMGMGAYESMRHLNIRPIVTDHQEIELAVKEYIEGKLIDHTERLH